MQEVFDFLTSAGIYHIATVDANGKPHTRPFGSKQLFEGKFYISTTNDKPVYEQLKSPGSFEISAMGKGREWVRIEGTAVEVTDADLKAKIHAARNAGPSRPIEQAAYFELTGVNATIFRTEETKSYSW